MKMTETPEARIELAAAKARVLQIAAEIRERKYPDQEDFRLLWELGFVGLRKLEDYRAP